MAMEPRPLGAFLPGPPAGAMGRQRRLASRPAEVAARGTVVQHPP